MTEEQILLAEVTELRKRNLSNMPQNSKVSLFPSEYLFLVEDVALLGNKDN